MKSIKSTALSMLALLIFFVTPHAQAAGASPQPQRCPNSSALLAAGLAGVEDEEAGKYFAYQFSNYGTAETWGFLIFDIYASSKQDAFSKGKTALNTISYLYGPTYIAKAKVWGCVYNVSGGYTAVAITPIDAGVQSSKRMIKQIRF